MLPHVAGASGRERQGRGVRVLGVSFADRPGREKFWGLARPGELGKVGLARLTGVWGVLVLGSAMLSSVEDVSIRRIMGREDGAAVAAWAAAAAWDCWRRGRRWSRGR